MNIGKKALTKFRDFNLCFTFCYPCLHDEKVNSLLASYQCSKIYVLTELFMQEHIMFHLFDQPILLHVSYILKFIFRYSLHLILVPYFLTFATNLKVLVLSLLET